MHHHELDFRVSMDGVHVNDELSHKITRFLISLSCVSQELKMGKVSGAKPPLGKSAFGHACAAAAATTRWTRKLQHHTSGWMQVAIAECHCDCTLVCGFVT